MSTIAQEINAITTAQGGTATGQTIAEAIKNLAPYIQGGGGGEGAFVIDVLYTYDDDSSYERLVTPLADVVSAAERHEPMFVRRENRTDGEWDYAPVSFYDGDAIHWNTISGSNYPSAVMTLNTATLVLGTGSIMHSIVNVSQTLSQNQSA
jgi:hypothetical protein